VAASRLGVPPLAELVADAVAVARGLGLGVDDPVVIKHSLNLLVWLRPAPVVARMHVRTSLVRNAEPAADSLALATFLAKAGLPVSPPVYDVDPGPHVGVTGRPMTLWRHLPLLDERADAAAAGRALRRLHEVMADYDGPLRHIGPLEEIGRLAGVLDDRGETRDAATIRSLLDRVNPPRTPVQALHGDAHLGNVRMTASGLRWLDWEESWRGPVAWDLASLEHRRATFDELRDETRRAFEGYGAGGYDAEAVEAWLPVVSLWAAAWGLVGELDGLGWGDSARRRLVWAASRLGG
jgi:Ser/Thr protein kinase RdoA (MazF antagonist)